MKRNLILLSLLMTACSNMKDPLPYGPVPSDKQVEWQQLEYYMFVHFGPNTFTDVEWGNGKEDPKVFYPTDLDCSQWAKIAREAGMKGIIITAKHHDGFCLWPSKYSTHTVRESLWKDGKGDVLRELSDACREEGLKFGVYISPWDQNHPSYGSPDYNQTFSNTLTEVLSSYGDVFEQWFDGAGGEDPKLMQQHYDWPLYNGTVHKLQPNAVIFSDVGPGCRWMGNERGVAGETNWSLLDIEGFEPGIGAPPSDTLNRGNKYGHKWVPAEVDVSIRPGWFYSASSDSQVKTVEKLMEIYFTSVGRNANLLLNVPPDRRGRIHPLDSARLMEFRAVRERTFEVDYARTARIDASSSRGFRPRFSPSNLNDGKYDTFWTTNDDVSSASIILDLKERRDVKMVVLQEYIPLGQRVERFSIEIRTDDNSPWHEVFNGTTIGYKRIALFPEQEAEQIKVNIINSLACPIISTINVY